jgi:hypothetical protein
MSLKGFHIFFISAAALLALGFGLWCFTAAAGVRLPGSAAYGAASLASAVALVVYGRIFLSKMKREGIR